MALCNEVLHGIEAEDLIKVVNDGEGLGLEVLNGAETDKAQLDTHEHDHDRDDAFEKEHSRQHQCHINHHDGGKDGFQLLYYLVGCLGVVGQLQVV
jgi:hypothetical protein